MKTASFVFRLTALCNKRCPSCCCGTATMTMSPSMLQLALGQISVHLKKRSVAPTISFTGGEVFLYRYCDDSGTRFSIADVVRVTRQVLPRAAIILKTSGWSPHRRLDSLLRAVMDEGIGGYTEVRLGFNLYQNFGLDAEGRLRHMLESILTLQNIVRVETIYDRANMRPTFGVIQKVLNSMGVPVIGLEDTVSHPELGCRVKVPINNGGGALLLSAMPAHPGVGGQVDGRFIEAPAVLCPAIEHGSLAIMYHPDLSFSPCNDAFADYGESAFSADDWPSLSAQVEFLSNGFSELKKRIREESIRFTTRRERCLYCNRFLRQLATSGSDAAALITTGAPTGLGCR